MRPFGLFLIGLGLIGLVTAMGMDTTVETGGETLGSGEFSFRVPKSRVHNIGLMDERRNFLIASGVGILAGAILFGFGTVAGTSSPRALAETSSARAQAVGTVCPWCNGPLNGTPEICRHCRQSLEWVEGRPSKPEQAVVERAKSEKRRQEHEELERTRREQREAIARHHNAALEKRRQRYEQLETIWKERKEAGAKFRRAELVRWQAAVAGICGRIGAAAVRLDSNVRNALGGEAGNRMDLFLRMLLYVLVPISLLVALSVLVYCLRG